MSTEDYAVLQTGGKQYKVTPESEILVNRMESADGEEYRIKDVLLIRQGEKVLTGRPYVSGAEVVTQVVAKERGPKLIVFKKRSKKGYKKKQGHRQDLTRLRVKEIVVAEA